MAVNQVYLSIWWHNALRYVVVNNLVVNGEINGQQQPQQPLRASATVWSCHVFVGVGPRVTEKLRSVIVPLSVCNCWSQNAGFRLLGKLGEGVNWSISTAGWLMINRWFPIVHDGWWMIRLINGLPHYLPLQQDRQEYAEHAKGQACPRSHCYSYKAYSAVRLRHSDSR